MSPEAAKKRIKDFLLSKDALCNEIIFDIAKNKLAKIKKIARHHIDDKGDDDISKEEIVNYIAEHFNELKEDIDKILDDLSEKIIPEKNYVFILKQSFLLAAFILPSAWALIHCIINFYCQPEPQIGLMTTCAVALVSLLVVVLVAIDVIIFGARKHLKN